MLERPRTWMLALGVAVAVGPACGRTLPVSDGVFDLSNAGGPGSIDDGGRDAATGERGPATRQLTALAVIASQPPGRGPDPGTGKYPQGVPVFFVATCSFDDGTTVMSNAMNNIGCTAGTDFTWGSSSTQIISVPANSTGRGVTNPTGTGTANVTAAAGDIVGFVSITVYNAPPGFVFLSLDAMGSPVMGPLTLTRGARQQAFAFADYQNTGGGRYDVTDVATWTSSNAMVAAVGRSGEITVPNNAPIGGMANINAVFAGKSTDPPLIVVVR